MSYKQKIYDFFLIEIKMFCLLLAHQKVQKKNKIKIRQSVSS